MGNSFAFYRMSTDALLATAFLPKLLGEWLKENPEAQPQSDETAGDYLGWLTAELGSEAATQEYILSLGARMTFSSDRTGDFFIWLDRTIREYGDLELLAFLLYIPSRSDFEQHLLRLPDRAKRLGLAAAAVCLDPAESRALAFAVKAGVADRFMMLPLTLRPEDALCAALIDDSPQEGEIGVWLFQGDDGVHDLDSMPAQRGGIPEAPKKSSMSAEGKLFIVGAALVVLLFAGLALLIADGS